jgi:hypothetical protein
MYVIYLNRKVIDMVKVDQVTPQVNIRNYLKYVLGALLGMFISGTAMTAIGQPTDAHILSNSGNKLWHLLLVLHLMFLVVMVISAVAIFIISRTKMHSIKARSIIGLMAILFGIVSGTLVLHKIHPGVFLFCMALSFLAIGATYGPMGGNRMNKQ